MQAVEKLCVCNGFLMSGKLFHCSHPLLLLREAWDRDDDIEVSFKAEHTKVSYSLPDDQL